MEFQFDCEKKRRLVEGWNCIVYEAEDKINLSASEYEQIAFDFESNSMIFQAEKAYKRAIKLGSKKSRYLLAKLLEMRGQSEAAYEWYLEAALGNYKVAIKRLAEMYRQGTNIRKDIHRAEELEQYLYEVEKNQEEGGNDCTITR